MKRRDRPARSGRAKRAVRASRHSALREAWAALVRARAAVLLSVVVALGLYAQTLSYDFARDDYDMIVQNGALRGGAPLGVLLTSDFTAGHRGESGKWRPVVTFANWLDGRAGGWTPGAFHRTNVIGYVLCCLLFALLLSLMRLPVPATVAASALFATMPLHVESVAWISGRTDLFATLFLLVACVGDQAAWRAGRRWPGFVASLGYGLALGSKETALAFLVVAASLAWVRTSARDGRGKAVAVWLAPYAAVTLAYLAARAAFVAMPDRAGSPLVDLELARMQALTLLPVLLGFLSPWALRAPDMVAREPTSLLVAVAVALHVAFFAAWLFALTRRRAVSAAIAWLWVPVLIATALGLLRSEVVSAELVFAERLMMVGSVGAAWIVGWLVARVPATRARNFAWAAVAIVALGSAFQTWRYVPDWRNNAAMYQAVMERQANNPVGYLGMAGVRLGEGRVDDALALIQTAEGLDPDIPEIHQFRAEIAFSRGDWQQVVVQSERTLERDPGRTYPRILRAAARVRMGEIEAAASELQTLLPVVGADPLVAGAWGEVLLGQDDPGGAEPYLRRAAAANPRDARTQYLYGTALAATGRLQEARIAFERTVAVDPGAYDAWLALGILHHAAGRTDARDASLERARALPQAADGRADSVWNAVRSEGP